MVEIKARFDERANIVWARALERAGAHVAYGLVGLKTHSKAALVVRREGRGLRRYVHIGTGNYNPKTARVYADLGLLTDDTALDRGRHRPVQRAHRRRAQGPLPPAAGGAREPAAGIAELIAAETERQRAHGDGRIVMKVNAIVDPGIIAALYRASQAGVPIDLIVRGMCSRRAGRPGRQRDHPGALRRRPLPRALADPVLRPGRAGALPHRLGRHDGAQPRPTRRGPGAGRRTRRSRTACGPSSRSCSRDDRRAWSLDAEGDWKRVEAQVESPAGVDTFRVLADLAASTRADPYPMP